MNVKQLIKQLQGLKDKTKEVFLASDEEGNNFQGVDGVFVTSEKPDHSVVIWPNHTFHDLD